MLWSSSRCLHLHSFIDTKPVSIGNLLLSLSEFCIPISGPIVLIGAMWWSFLGLNSWACMLLCRHRRLDWTTEAEVHYPKKCEERELNGLSPYCWSTSAVFSHKELGTMEISGISPIWQPEVVIVESRSPGRFSSDLAQKITPFGLGPRHEVRWIYTSAAGASVKMQLWRAAGDQCTWLID